MKLTNTLAILALCFSLSSFANNVNILETKPETLKGRMAKTREGIKLNSARSLFAPVGLNLYRTKGFSTNNYKVTLRFKKNKGTDSFGLVMPVGNSLAQIVLGGWGNSYSGISYLDNIPLNSRKNATYAPAGFSYEKDSILELDVSETLLTFSVNGKVLSQIDPREHSFHLHSNFKKYMPEGDDQSKNVLLWVLRGSVEIKEFRID